MQRKSVENVQGMIFLSWQVLQEVNHWVHIPQAVYTHLPIHI
jgi:hypothetical protein